MSSGHAERRRRNPCSPEGPRSRALAPVLVSCALLCAVAAQSDAAEPTRAPPPRTKRAVRARVEGPAVAERDGITSRSADGAEIPAAAGSDALPFQHDTDSGAPSGWAIVRGGLFIGVILAVAAAVLLRRRVARSPPLVAPGRAAWGRWLAPAGSQRLQVLHSARLGARASVHVVRWDAEEWLVGCADHGVTVLGRRTPASESAASAAVDLRSASHASRSDRGDTGEPS